MKIIGHVGHFRWLRPNVWCKISQLWIEYIKLFGQMSDETWKFFGFTVITWCHQATSHYLSQCWPRSVSPYGITRLQWVKIVATFPRDHCIFMVSEFKELQDQLSDYKVVRYIPSDKDLKTLKDGGVAVIDQWICTHARWGNNSQVNIKSDCMLEANGISLVFCIWGCCTMMIQLKILVHTAKLPKISQLKWMLLTIKM